jgi:hypothetical protein
MDQVAGMSNQRARIISHPFSTGQTPGVQKLDSLHTGRFDFRTSKLVPRVLIVLKRVFAEDAKRKMLEFTIRESTSFVLSRKAR